MKTYVSFMEEITVTKELNIAHKHETIPSPMGSSAMPCHFTPYLFQAFESWVCLCSEMYIFK